MVVLRVILCCKEDIFTHSLLVSYDEHTVVSHSCCCNDFLSFFSFLFPISFTLSCTLCCPLSSPLLCSCHQLRICLFSSSPLLALRSFVGMLIFCYAGSLDEYKYKSVSVSVSSSPSSFSCRCLKSSTYVRTLTSQLRLSHSNPRNRTSHT